MLVCALVSVALSWSTGGFINALVHMGLVLLAITQLISPTPVERFEQKIAALRQQGIYPPEGQGTDEDVKRLAKAGHRIFSIRLYRQIHNVPLKQADEAVKRLILLDGLLEM